MLHRTSIYLLVGLTSIFLFVASTALMMALNRDINKPITIMKRACDKQTDWNSITITGTDGITLWCLMNVEQKPFYAFWSPDESRLQFAILNDKITLPAWSGRWGYYRPPATFVFVLDADGKNLQHFLPADNGGFRFSPDGQYAQIYSLCDYGKCEVAVYHISEERKICEYENVELWYRDKYGVPKCPILPLRNGLLWDIRKETNDAGCAYYRRLSWDRPSCK